MYDILLNDRSVRKQTKSIVFKRFKNTNEIKNMYVDRMFDCILKGGGGMEVTQISELVAY